MKYFYSLILTLFLFYGNSQTYYPTGTDSTTYSVGCFILNTPGSGLSTWIEQYTFRGDTIINRKSYVKVYYSDDNIIDTNYDVNSTLINYSYIFAVRDSAKKVFTIKANQSSEKLVYDFGLSVGDTMNHYLDYSSFSIGISVLSRIDSFLVNYPAPHFRKKYFYSGQLSSSFNQFGEIEGMATAFFGRMDSEIRSGGCVRMACIQQKDLYIYKSCDTCDCYSILVDIIRSNLDEKSIGEIKVYPNPFSDIINIDFSTNQIAGIVKILDVSGREVLNRKVNHNKSIEINLSEVQSGVYIVSLETNGEMRFAKIVKE